MKNTLSLMTVCSMLLTLVARGQVASADHSKTSPADSGDVTAGLTVAASQPASNAPVITRVSPILPRRNQTIVIEGNGFGNSPPKLVPVGDAVDTDARNGRRPTLAVRNRGRGADDWQAGLASDGGANAIGVKLVSWTDTNITLAGFGDALGDEQNDGNWKIAAGDPIEITVFGPAGSAPAKFAATVTTLPAEDKASVPEAQASGESGNVKSQILFSQWFASLPVLVVWAVGLVLAVKRWRERPPISILVAISCAVALLTLIFMPLAVQIGSQIKYAFVPPLLTLVRACLGALSIGLLLKAVFVERGKSELKAPEQPDQSGPAVITGPMGTALKILAGIFRWSWRVVFIGFSLFGGVFLLAGIGNYHVLSAGDIIAVAVGVLLFAVAILAWWREGWGGLIILLTFLFVTISHVTLNVQQGMKANDILLAVKDDLGGTIIAVVLLMSWALHQLMNPAITRFKRRRVLCLVMTLVVLSALWVWAYGIKFPEHFNP